MGECEAKDLRYVDGGYVHCEGPPGRKRCFISFTDSTVLAHTIHLARRYSIRNDLISAFAAPSNHPIPYPPFSYRSVHHTIKCLIFYSPPPAPPSLPMQPLLEGRWSPYLDFPIIPRTNNHLSILLFHPALHPTPRPSLSSSPTPILPNPLFSVYAWVWGGWRGWG